MGQLVQFSTNHWALCLALLVILILVFINEFITQKKRAKMLSPSAAIDMINNENALVMDLRDPDTFRTGHIIDALCVPPDDFSQKRIEKYKTKPIILVCARGIQSSTTATKLREQGFSQIMVLAGGIVAWQTAGLPLVKGK